VYKQFAQADIAQLALLLLLLLLLLEQSITADC
jgi:hypothetical protein